MKMIENEWTWMKINESELNGWSLMKINESEWNEWK